MKPDPKQILRDAAKLKTDRFSLRDTDLMERESLRFRRKEPDVPAAYKKTATVYKTPLIQEEGRQLAATIAAFPQVHMPPPSPELQPQTTLCEQWVQAAHQELESHYGHIWDKCRQSQIHAKIGWIYLGAKRKPYDGEPAPPKDPDYDQALDYRGKQDAFKRETGIAGFIDYRHVPTQTVISVGDVANPLAIYESKNVDEQELILMYGLTRDRDGKLSKPDLTTMPSGEPTDSGRSYESKKLRVVEYWDREWCMIVAENGTEGWRHRQDAFVLEEWQHNWGRVPYFAAPAFETDMLAEEHKYESPLDGIYAEAEMYNMLRTMMANLGYLTGWPSWQILTQKDGELILDDSDKPKTMVEFTPGTMLQLAPGQTVGSLPMEGGRELQLEVQASEARLKQYSIADIAKGIAPGADTANSAITQLKRLQRSSLQPMADNSARQARQMYQFLYARVKEFGEPVYVYSKESGETMGLSGDQIPTMNIQVKVSPDTGQDNLVNEKHNAEMWQLGLIPELVVHERSGIENPEEMVRANVLERLWRVMEPQMQTQILADLGNVDAIAQLIEANQETGDARTGLPKIMEQVRAAQEGNSGMGEGSPGQPRAMGVRSPAIATNTQPEFGE